LGNVFAYSMTPGTFTTPPMLMPQWHTKTPMRGSWPETSISGGYSLGVASFPLSLATVAPARAAAPLPCATVSGMSLGDATAPLTKMPGTLVSSGPKVEVAANPCSLSLTPRFLASV